MSETPEGRDSALATVLQAAEYLNVSRSIVYDLMNEEKLPSIYLRTSRRIRWADLRRLAGEDGGAE